MAFTVAICVSADIMIEFRDENPGKQYRCKSKKRVKTTVKSVMHLVYLAV